MQARTSRPGRGWLSWPLRLLLAAAGTAAGNTQAQAPADPYNHSRTSSYTYYQPADGAKAGLLKSETVEPGNAPSCVTTTYDYDGYGNKKQTTVANCPGAAGRAVFDSRSSSTTYAGVTQAITVAGSATVVVVPAGQFPDSGANALGHIETRQVDPRFGVVIQLTGPNQLSTRVEVDDFGRTVREIRADGTRTLSWTCFVAAGMDTSSNTVIDGVGCPAPSAAEIPADALLFRHSEERDTQGRKMGSFARVYSDRLGREIRSVSEGFDGAGQPAGKSGALVVRDTRYSAQGMKVLQTQPYYLASGSSTLGGSNDQGVTRTDYDALGRPVAVYVAEPNGSQAGSQAVDFGPYGTRRAARRTFAYAALATTNTDDASRSRIEEKNALGEMVRITDPTGAQLVHQHDAFGNLVATKDALQNRITLAYDIRGRKLQMTDPDAGAVTYCHDALGQLKAQQNASLRGSGSSTCPDIADSGLTATAVPGWATLAYDRLGRLTQRAEPELISTWSYDRYAGGGPCDKGTGKLCESRTGNGVNRKWVYDTLGRLVNQRTDMLSGPSFATARAYDGITGRQSGQTYPTGIQVAYGYTALGYLDRLSLATAATVNPLPATPGGAPGASATLPAGTVLWQAQQVNAWDKTEQQSFGNGVIGRAAYEAATGRSADVTAGVGTGTSVLSHHYTWSSLGNLMTRGDSNGDGSTGAVSEQFGYDAQDRLASYTVAAPAIPKLARSVTLQYNALGMLLFKSDVGNYAYGAQGPGAVRPHALQSVTGAGSTSYGYDANGNLTSASAGKYRSIAYTSFNLSDSQTGAQGPAGTPKYQWLYDEGHARVKETRSDANGTRVTWFLHPDNAGGLGFESETTGSAVSNRHYLSAGGISVGVLVSSGALPSLDGAQTAPTVLANVTLAKLEYWHKDHLGSLVATTDHTGAVTARYAYDPFGKRRFTQGTYDAAGTLVIDWSNAVNNGTDRGFTGHEHLDDLGLIHMNGRIYDPAFGRFLSADPHITFPGDLQNYDRYAYVLNNPLATTDPTGLDPCDGECKRKARNESLGSIAGPGRDVRVIVLQVSGTPVDQTTTVGGKPGQSGGGGTFNGIAPSAAAVAAVAGQVAGGVNNLITGGYGDLTEEAIKAGDYGMGLAYTVAGAAYGVANVVSMGSGAMVNTVRTMGSEVAAAAGSLALKAEALFLSKAEQFGACFTEGTPVHTAAGLTPIEDIREGDFVAARDEQTGELSWRPVVRLFRNADRETVRVSYVNEQGDEETIGASLEHPFQVAGRGWVGAGELKPGDRLARRDGGELTVRQVVRDPVRQDTFNFEVAGVHTYFVGSLGAWVHNASVVGDVFGRGVQAGEAGRFAALDARAIKGDGLTPHHMPQAAAGRTSRADGGALVMTQVEHEATRTYGARGARTAAAEVGLTFRAVLAKDIRDVRQIVGPRYNEGLRDLIQYYRESFPGLIGK